MTAHDADGIEQPSGALEDEDADLVDEASAESFPASDAPEGWAGPPES